jgi:hypothetical protein
MRFPVTFGLGRLVQPLPLRAIDGVLTVDRLAEGFHDREHLPVAQIAVVRDRQDLAAGLLLVGVHPFPQVGRVVAAERWVDGKRIDLPRLVAVVAEDDVPMKVVAARVRRPLVADESGEATGLVVLLSGIDRFLPRALVSRRPGKEHQVLGKLAARERDDDLHRGIVAFAPLDHVVPLLPGGVLQQRWCAGKERGEETHVVGMIGDDQEIQRTRQFDHLTARGLELLTAPETVGVFGPESTAEGARIHREGGVQVRIAEVRARGEIALGIRRIAGTDVLRARRGPRHARILCVHEKPGGCKYHTRNRK